MRISVIIPVFNEKNHITEIIEAVEAVPLEKEIIVIDDCSSDGTRNILKTRKGIKTILHDRNMGKGAAIRSGLSLVSGDYVVIQDADLEYTPQEYVKLLKPIEEGETRVVYGSRILGKGEFLKSSYIANRVLTLLTNLLFHMRNVPKAVPQEDTQTGRDGKESVLPRAVLTRIHVVVGFVAHESASYQPAAVTPERGPERLFSAGPRLSRRCPACERVRGHDLQRG